MDETRGNRIGLMEVKMIARLYCMMTVSMSLLCSGICYSIEEPAAPDEMALFPGLKQLQLKNEGVTLYYDPALSEIINGEHPEAKTHANEGIRVSRPLRTQLLGSREGYFTIDCDSGESWDPGCTILQEKNGKLEPVIHIPGLCFYFPGNGNIYVSGHNNTMFNTRKKYQWRNGTFVEVRQPFRLVGLETTTKAAIEIFSSKDYKQVVASLPKDSKVSVVLNEGEHYLLKTPFGLLGWIRIPDGTSRDESPIVGIYFAGD